MTIDPHDARSWILVNVLFPEKYDHAAASSADAIILDLEDAVAPEKKPQARQKVLELLKDSPHPLWIRINAYSTEHWKHDISALHGAPNVAGVMLAKSNSAEQVTRTSEALGDKPVLALIETAVGITRVQEIASAQGCFRLAFGTGDFRRDTGLSSTLALASSRAALSIASSVAGLPGPIDGPTVVLTNEQLVKDAATSVEFGMSGKITLHTSQCQLINEEFSPTATDVQWAESFLNEFHAAGGHMRDGSDPPHLAQAHSILEQATKYNIPFNKKVLEYGNVPS